MNDLVLIQQDRPSVQIQDSSTITVLDSPDIVNVENNANIIVSNSDLPVFVKYSTQKGEDGHTPTNEEITDLVTPEFIISKLTGQIKSTELYGDLASRIDKIAVLENSVFNLNNAIASTVTETDVAAILEDYSTTADTTTAIAQTRDGLLSTMGNNIATSLSEYTTTANLDGAIATKVDTLIAATGNSLGDLSAALEVEQKVRAQTIAPLWVSTKEYQKGESVFYSEIIYQCVTPLLGINKGLIPSSNPTHWKLVQANLYAQYSIKTDVNGNVAGFGLANDGATSEFSVLADRFSIVDPDDPITKAAPFIYTNGVVYINSAMIEDGTITNAMLIDGTITNAKIKDTIQSTNYDGLGNGWKIDKDANCEFNNGLFRGVVEFKKTDGTFQDMNTLAMTPGPTGPQGIQGAQGVSGNDGIQGPAGNNGLSSYFHVAYATDAAGGGFSQLPAGKTYIGTYVDFTLADSTIASMYTWVLIKGEDGLNGDQGIPGTNGSNGLTSYLHTAYATNITGTTGFDLTSPVGKTYIGTYVDFVSSDSTNPALYTWALFVGPQGATGATGSTGVQGIQGIQGVTGAAGIQGPAGANGLSSYFHIAYADTSIGGGFSQSPTGKIYIGTYSDFTAADSSNAAAYTWSLIKGTDGLNGANGLPGTNGVNGLTSYLHTAYATNSSGTTGFDLSNPSGKTYIGTYVDFTEADSANPALYAWVLFQGPTGATGATGPTGATGDTGATGATGVTGASVMTVYIDAASPTTPSASVGVPSGWSATAPTTATYAIWESTGNRVAGGSTYTWTPPVVSTAHWVKPGQTTIDGNKIFTGDAYVDTLQIKGEAVVVTRFYESDVVSYSSSSYGETVLLTTGTVNPTTGSVVVICTVGVRAVYSMSIAVTTMLFAYKIIRHGTITGATTILDNHVAGGNLLESYVNNDIVSYRNILIPRTLIFKDTPGDQDVYYEIRLRSVGANSMYVNGAAGSVACTLMGCKR